MNRERLQRLLGAPQLAELRRRLRRRYEQGRANDIFVLHRLVAAERAALESLLGRKASTASSMRLSLGELDAVLARSGIAGSLREALELLDGPVIDRAAIRAERDTQWREVCAAAGHPGLAELLQDASARGLLKRCSGSQPERAQRLLADACRVLQQLPAPGLPLSQLAAASVGDAHALDAGRPLAALVLAACERGRSPDEDEDDAGERVRERWARAGVLVNELARPVLVLNLPAGTDSASGRLLAQAAAVGEPLHLTLRLLLRDRPRWQLAQREVFVCENPAIVVLAADRLGAGSAPLVCTEGMPAAAQRTLLLQLADSGARLRYHGDFDWPGLRIGNLVRRSFGAQPWRFGADDYRAADLTRGLALQGDPQSADWDPQLGPEMARQGRAVHEEALVESLLEDLRRAGAGHSHQGPVRRL